MNEFYLAVGKAVVALLAGGVFPFLLLSAIVWLLDRGLRKLGLLLVVASWAKAHRPGLFKLAATGLRAPAVKLPRELEPTPPEQQPGDHAHGPYWS